MKEQDYKITFEEISEALSQKLGNFSQLNVLGTESSIKKTENFSASLESKNEDQDQHLGRSAGGGRSF